MFHADVSSTSEKVEGVVGEALSPPSRDGCGIVVELEEEAVLVVVVSVMLPPGSDVVVDAVLTSGGGSGGPAESTMLPDASCTRTAGHFRR